MTTAQSTIRLILYVLTAMVAAAAGGIATVDFTDQKQVWIFGLSVAGVGLTTARSYIDKSPSEVVK